MTGEDQRVLVHQRPPPQLGRYVLSYEGYRERGLAPFVMREVPRGFTVMIIGFGPPFRVGPVDQDFARAESHRSFFAGAHDRPTLVGSTGSSHCIQVNLTLPGAVRVLAMPLRELANRVVALEDVLGSAQVLTERLWGAADWDARFALLSDWLAGRLARATDAPAELDWAWHRLDRAEAGLAVAGLADDLGCSRKHLSVRFRDLYGLPPSTMGQVLRFARTLDRLDQDPGQALSELALAGGYSDQPHLNRAFQRFAGLTPTAYLRHRLPAPGGLAEPR